MMNLFRLAAQFGKSAEQRLTSERSTDLFEHRTHGFAVRPAQGQNT
jgi:hypothetical protein